MIDYIETHITDHCNLRCSGCSHFSCIATRDNKNVFEFEKELKRIAEFGVKTFRIMGGEPLLHPMWLYCCVTARQILGNETNIVLVTNGTMNDVISKNAEVLNNNRITVCQSIYGIDTEPISGVNNVIRHGKQQMYNISLDLEGNQNKVNSFNHCDLARNRWYFLRNGKLYSCCVMPNIHIFNRRFTLGISGEDAGIDIFSHTEEEIKAYLNAPHDACRYCDTVKREHNYHGFCVTKGDIAEWIR